MGQFKFVLWLAYWYLQNETFQFEWDHGNFTKSSTKHGVASDEVESVFMLRMAVPIGRQISPEVDEERLCVVGPSLNGKFIQWFSLYETDGCAPLVQGQQIKRRN